MNKKNRLVYFAKKHLDKPYKFGADPSEAPKTFDCSSFVQYLYKRVGISLPRTALDQASVGKTMNYPAAELAGYPAESSSVNHSSPHQAARYSGSRIESKKELLETGDLLFFKGGWGHYSPEYPMGIGHVGIYIGNGKVINARSKEIDGREKGSVIEEDVESFLDRKDFVVAKRIL